MISYSKVGKCVAEIWQGNSAARDSTVMKEAVGWWRREHDGT